MSEDEDRSAGSHRADGAAPGPTGAWTGPHGHRRGQEPGEARRASRQPEGNPSGFKVGASNVFYVTFLQHLKLNLLFLISLHIFLFLLFIKEYK